MVKALNWTASASISSGRLGFVKQEHVESDFFWLLISSWIRLLNVSSGTVCVLTSWGLSETVELHLISVFYTKLQRPFLYVRHWYVFICKVIFEMFQFYLSFILILKNGAYSLSSRDVYSNFTLPKVKTEMGRRAFRFSAPTTWNVLQLDHKLHNLAPLNYLGPW